VAGWLMQKVKKKGSLLVIILSEKYGAEIKHRTTERVSLL